MKNIIQNEILLLRKKMPLLFLLAWDEIKARYARSVLGPFWLVMATAVSAIGLSYVWSILFNQDKATFVSALCIGLVIWQFLSLCIIEAPNCFNVYSPIIKNSSTPLLLFPAAIVLKNFIIFLHNLVIIAVVLLIYPPPLSFNMFFIIPGLLLVLVSLLFVTTILAFVGARYRDVGPAIASMMSIIFFLSPVIYKPEQLGVKAHLIWFNPFSYLISLIRDPITGYASQPFVYAVTGIAICVCALLSFFLLSRYRYRVVFWL